MNPQPPDPDQPPASAAHIPWARPVGAPPAGPYVDLPIAYATVTPPEPTVSMDYVWAWISLALFAVCAVLFLISQFVGVVLLGPEQAMLKAGPITAIGQILTMGFFPVAIVLVARGSVRRDLHLHRPHMNLLLALIPIVLVWPITSQLMSQYLGTVFPPDSTHLELMGNIIEWQTPTQALLVIAQIALVPAVFEELLFRGLLLSALRRLIGDWPAVIIVGTGFAAAHVVFLVFAAPAAALGMMIPLTFLGLGLTILTVRTGTILYASILHFANNLLALVMANHLSDEFAEVWMADGVALAVLAPIAIAVLIGWMIVAGRTIPPSPERQRADPTFESDEP